MLASDSGVARGKPEIARYDPSRQGAAGAALLTAPKAYNPDADVTADAGKEQKKAKKKKVCNRHRADGFWTLGIACSTTIAQESRDLYLKCVKGGQKSHNTSWLHTRASIGYTLPAAFLDRSSAAAKTSLPLQKKDAGAEEAAAVDGGAAAANGAMEIDAPTTSAEPAVNGTATAEKKKKKKKRSAEEAALESAPAEDGAAAGEASKPKKKKEKAPVNGVADAPTTEKKV